MADTFPIWQRQVMPEGRLAIPQAGPSLAESFGLGLRQLAKGGDNLAELTGATRDNPKPEDALWVAARAVEARHELTQWHEDAKHAAPTGADGFAGAAADRFDQTVAKMSATAPDAHSAAALAGRLQGFRAEFLDDALRFEAGARLARRADTLATTIDLARRTVVLAPGQFDASMDDVTQAIESQPMPAPRKAELVARAQRGLAESYLQGLLERDPEALKRAIHGKTLDSLLDRHERSRWLAAADARRAEILQSNRAGNHAGDAR